MNSFHGKLARWFDFTKLDLYRLEHVLAWRGHVDKDEK
jgi:hypothetical protein